MTELERARQRRAEIAARIEAYNAAHSANWTDANQTEWDAINAEYTAAGNEVTRLETVRDITATMAAGQGRQIVQTPGDAPLVHVDGASDTGGFRNLGEYVQAIFTRPGDPRVQALTMETGEEGGYLVPPQFMTELLQVSPESSVVRPRATVINSGSEAEITFPALTQGSLGAYGGVSLTWVEEGTAPAEATAKIEQVSLKPKEISAYMIMTDKLLRNAPAVSTIVSTLMRNALNGAEDYAFLRGNGVGKPLGLISCPGRKNVTRNTATNVKYEDVLSMQKGMLPESRGRAVWIANQSAFSVLKDMKDSSGNRIYTMQNLPMGYPATLDGIPIIYTGRTPVLGTEGDLILADLSYYLIDDGLAPTIASSQHVYFTANKTVLKIVRSVDGQGWVREPLTLEDGSTTVSPFVVLK